MASSKDKKTILVPVDFSPHSDAAFDCAVEIAETLHLPLTVLHVIHDLTDAPGYYAVKGRKKQLGRLEDGAKEMMGEFLKAMKRKYAKRHVMKTLTSILVAGLPVYRILEVSEKTDARMIVMGSQGRTGLQRLMLGSKAEQVVRLSPLSVLIVKVPEPDAKDVKGRK